MAYKDREDQRAYARRHYEANKSEYKYRAKVHRREHREAMCQLLQEYKESQPCADCKVYYPYYVMQFDHVRGTKLYNVANMTTRSLEMVLEEIAKCELVCGNCHAARTHLRRCAVVE